MNLSRIQLTGIGICVITISVLLFSPSAPQEEKTINSPIQTTEKKALVPPPKTMATKRLPKPIQTSRKLDLPNKTGPITRVPKGILGNKNPSFAITAPGKDIRYAASSNGLSRAFQKNMQQALSCYTETRKSFPNIDNRLSFSFHLTSVGEEGVIDQVSIDNSTTTYEEMEECIFDLFNTLRFYPPKEGEISLQHTITFTE